MKKRFHQIDFRHMFITGTEPKLVHCTRCAEEYMTTELVYGCREGETEYHPHCRTETCYGKFPQHIYPVEIVSA